MKGMKSSVVVLLLSLPLEVAAQNPLSTALPSPEINKDSWVIVEIWPDVKDITMAVYILDFSYEKTETSARQRSEYSIGIRRRGARVLVDRCPATAAACL